MNKTISFLFILHPSSLIPSVMLLSLRHYITGGIRNRSVMADGLRQAILELTPPVIYLFQTRYRMAKCPNGFGFRRLIFEATRF